MDTPERTNTARYIKGGTPSMLFYVLSLLLATLVTFASSLGLLTPDSAYPDEALRQAFFPNDVVNLVIGLPALLAALWLAWRGRLVGILFLPGALMFVLYNYLAYAFSMPPGWYYLLLMMIVMLSAYTLIGFTASLNAEAIAGRLEGRVPARLTGMLLVLFGAFVFLRVFSVVASSVRDPASVAAADLAVLPADFLIAPAWILGGVLLLLQRPLGYSAGLGLLFQACMLFVGLMGFMLLQPHMTGAAFDLAGLLIVAAMSLLCFVPFGLYLRGAAKSG
jgi:hypothetical protein